MFRISILGGCLIRPAAPPLSDCEYASRVNPWLFCVALSSTSLYLLLHLRMLCHGCDRVLCLLFLAWSARFGAKLKAIWYDGGGSGTGLVCHSLDITGSSLLLRSPDDFVFDQTSFSAAISLRLVQVAFLRDERSRSVDIWEVLFIEKDIKQTAEYIFGNSRGYYL